MLSPQHDAERVKELGDEPPFVISKHIRRGLYKYIEWSENPLETTVTVLLRSTTEQASLQNWSVFTKKSCCPRFIVDDAPRRSIATDSRGPAAGNIFKYISSFRTLLIVLAQERKSDETKNTSLAICRH